VFLTQPDEIFFDPIGKKWKNLGYQGRNFPDLEVAYPTQSNPSSKK